MMVTVVYDITFDEQSALAVDMYADPWAVPATARPVGVSMAESMRSYGAYRNYY